MAGPGTAHTAIIINNNNNKGMLIFIIILNLKRKVLFKISFSSPV